MVSNSLMAAKFWVLTFTSKDFICICSSFSVISSCNSVFSTLRLSISLLMASNSLMASKSPAAAAAVAASEMLSEIPEVGPPGAPRSYEDKLKC